MKANSGYEKKKWGEKVEMHHERFQLLLAP